METEQGAWLQGGTGSQQTNGLTGWQRKSFYPCPRRVRSFLPPPNHLPAAVKNTFAFLILISFLHLKKQSHTFMHRRSYQKKTPQWRFLSLSQYYRTINTDNLPPNIAGMNMPHCYRRWFGEVEVDKKAAEPWLSCRLHKFNSLVLSFGETLAKPKCTFCPKFALVVF